MHNRWRSNRVAHFWCALLSCRTQWVFPEGLSSLISDHRGEWHCWRALVVNILPFISIWLLSTHLHCLHLQQHGNKWDNSGRITESLYLELELTYYTIDCSRVKVQLIESPCYTCLCLWASHCNQQCPKCSWAFLQWWHWAEVTGQSGTLGEDSLVKHKKMNGCKRFV